MRKVWILVVLMYFSAICAMYSQPNCRDSNLGLNATGEAVFSLADIIPVGDDVAGATITIESFDGEVLFGPQEVDYLQLITFAACRYIDKSLKLNVKTEKGNCWATITFKKNFGPAIESRKFDVYCFDPIVNGPTDDGPQVLFSCFPGPKGKAEYVADWVDVVPCEGEGQDTAKIIYREWEKIDKDGMRGVGFDTIVVFNLPEITAENIYCQSRDSVFCGNPDDVLGPYVVYPAVPGDPSDCDTLFLLEFGNDAEGQLTITNTKFSGKCGLSSKIRVWEFDDECEDQYKISLDLKHECFGSPQSRCAVSPPAGTPPNGMENLAPGYWRCEMWLINIDTVPPEIHCKYPLLFQGEFTPAKWIESTPGDGDIDLDWAPYNITLIGDNTMADPDLATTYCRTVTKDTTIAFSWVYRSDGSDAAQDPFGFSLNQDFFQLTKGTQGGASGATHQNGYRIVDLKAGDTFCFEQRTSDGCCGAARTTIKPISIVSTSANDCAAHAYLPRIQANDAWSGVKAVKARIENIGTFVLEYDAEEDCYLTHEQPRLPYSFEPYSVIYSAFDSCHNVAFDTCFILVKDAVPPIAVADKGITVSLTDKKAWVAAESFDEGSSDNCGVNFVLARRSDWYESCIDLCDGIEKLCTDEHGIVLWKAQLEEDKDIDEVEAHYSQTLRWLAGDGRSCANIIYNAWQYDLIKRANFDCDKHPYDLPLHNLHQSMMDCSDQVGECFLPVYQHPDPLVEQTPENQPTDAKLEDPSLLIYSQIGGGWSKEVPFDCSDACGQVTVEILVMDYWCNWNTSWTKVWVEDKVPPTVIKDVEDGEITCKSYKSKKYAVEGHDHPLSIQEIVDLAKDDEPAAFEVLDDVFGGYEKVWLGDYGYVNQDGNPVEDEISFVDSSCYCEVDHIRRKRLYNHHTNEYYWKNDTIYDCGYEPDEVLFQQGQVLSNCPNYVGCEQEVWCDIDHCGEGVIYRKFRIWSGCPPSFYTEEGVPDSLLARHQPDTLTRFQVIHVVNDCGLTRHHFDKPPSIEIEDCGLVTEHGKAVGAAHPDHTGWLTYKFDDDCRIVGVDYEDKIFTIVGGDGSCYKIERTWYYMDWCNGIPDQPKWYSDQTLEIGSYVQQILLTDTTSPVCRIMGPTADGGVIEVGSCTHQLSVDVEVEDACGLSSYFWEVKEVKGSATSVVDLGQGLLSSRIAENFEITTAALQPGEYKLKVRVVDDCSNESYCEYNFEIQQVKKPTPICILMLTAKLTPMDLNQDGAVDTAMTTIWAKEFDRSSEPACEDAKISYRIELVDGLDDDTWAEDDDNLEVGCAHVGTQLVRLWVISEPSGTVDYCDVILQVQEPDHGCPESDQGGFDPNLNSVTLTNPAKFRFELRQNRPNPFFGATNIEYSLGQESEVTFSITTIAGSEVYRQTKTMPKGTQLWHVSDNMLTGRGVYFYRIESNGYARTRRMVKLN